MTSSNLSPDRRSVGKKIASFFDAYPVRDLEKRQIIIHAGDNISDVFYLIEGRVSQYDITPSGDEVVVNEFKPGAFFPMSAALNDVPNLYFFEAATQVRLHVAPQSDALRFLLQHPDVSFDLLTRVYKGMDGVLRRMIHLMGGSATTRLLFELLNAARRFGEIQADQSVIIPLKEGDIARHAGLTRETINRELKKLKVAGLVAIDRRGIIVFDMSKLESRLGSVV